MVIPLGDKYRFVTSYNEERQNSEFLNLKIGFAYNIENKAQRVPNRRRSLLKELLYLVVVNQL